ncbi:MAG: type II toxin-antitoxin system VapC family toxin [Microbacterium sp.]
MTLLGLIDSSALIGGLPPRVLDNLDQYCSSTIVRAELSYGLHAFQASSRVDRTARRETLLRVLDSLPGFWSDFDLAASEGYGTLSASTTQAMRVKDALIAGHAHSLGIPILTRDAGFTRFTSVTVELIDAADGAG